MHLAGHQHCGTHIIDTHDREVTGEVWKLFQLAYYLTDCPSVLLEWDGDIPSFDVCHTELLKAKKFMSTDFNEPLEGKQYTSQESVSNPLNIVTPELIYQSNS